jgi:hypothetical protein
MLATLRDMYIDIYRYFKYFYKCFLLYFYKNTNAGE